MRTRLVLVPLSAAVVGLASSSLAAPPGSETTFTTYYGRGGHFAACTVGATCTGAGSADGTSGVAKAESSYVREVAATGEEYSFAYGSQRIWLKVPPGANKATVTFTWNVISSTAAATATKGDVGAQTVIFAYPPACREGSKCSYVTQHASVTNAWSTDGLGAPRSAVGTPGIVTVTTTITGDLPRNLGVDSYPYAQTIGSASEICIGPVVAGCTPTDPEHAGRAEAAIEADLLKAEVVYG